MSRCLNLLQGLKAHGQKGFAVLFDPDKSEADSLQIRVRRAEAFGVTMFLVGGSFAFRGNTEKTVQQIKHLTQKPVVLFPGEPDQLTNTADAVLFLSLLSGRNPEYLIGRQLVAAPKLATMPALEVIPTAYLLVDSGKVTAAQYISATLPLPSDKPELCANTALAGQYLGMQAVYLDAGSGGGQPVSPRLIAATRQATTLPLIVGGGIRTAEHFHTALDAGADLVVLGSIFEEQPHYFSNILSQFSRNNKNA